MPQNNKLVVGSTWTLLTTNDVVRITFQNLGRYPLMIYVTAGTVAPAETLTGLKYCPEAGEINRPLSDLAPGVTSGVRVWGRCPNSDGLIFVSHA